MRVLAGSEGPQRSPGKSREPARTPGAEDRAGPQQEGPPGPTRAGVKGSGVLHGTYNRITGHAA